MRTLLVVQAWAELLYVDVVGMRGFRALKQFIARTPTRPVAPAPTAIPAVVEAMKTASTLYVKGPLCLQRSAVVTRLLRRQGVPAHLVIGCHPAPMKAHAWVEVGGTVVSDDRDGLEYLHILDRW